MSEVPPTTGGTRDDADADDAPIDRSITPTGETGLPGPLVAEVVEYGNGTRECTLYPSDAPGDRDVAAWITAREGSFTDLRSVR